MKEKMHEIISEWVHYHIQKFGNLHLSMPCHFTAENGQYAWKHADFMYEHVLSRLLQNAESIVLRAYCCDWSDNIPAAHLPAWQPFLDAHVHKMAGQRNYFVLSRQAALSPELREFWFSHMVEWKECIGSENSLPTYKGYSVADIVLLIPHQAFPMDIFTALNLAQLHWQDSILDNPYTGFKKSTATWIRKTVAESPGYFLIPYRNPSGFTLKSDSESLAKLWLQCWDLSPAHEHAFYMPKSGESPKQAVIRLLEEMAQRNRI